MIDYISYLIYKYCRRGIIIDTNLMLVYIVGIYDPDYISQFKRTNKYDIEDFKYIHSVLSYFRKHITTPHIITELSNLSMKIQDNRLVAYFSVFEKLLKEMDEEYINKDEVLGLPLLPKLGITDLTIIEAAKRFKYLVFTDDFRATGYMRNMRIDVLNLNDIRTMQWMKN